MILYAKHLALMSLALWLVPIAGRVFARLAGRAYRVRRPGVGLGFLLSRLGLALVVPALAQGAYAVLSGEWPGFSEARLAALAVAGAVYGALFGDAQDYPRLPCALWGVLGGLGTGLLYASIPDSGEGRALCVALFAATPLLGYRPFHALVHRKIAAGGFVMPDRRVIR